MYRAGNLVIPQLLKLETLVIRWGEIEVVEISFHSHSVEMYEFTAT